MRIVVHMTMALSALDEETWGERFLRARRRSGISLQEAAHRISNAVTPVSYSTLMRIETLTAAPTGQRRRMFAYLAAVIYGYDPADFGLSADDLPRWIDEKRLSDLRDSQIIWSVSRAVSAA